MKLTVNINRVKCCFRGEGKPEYPEKTSWCRVENQQTQPMYDAAFGNRARATLVGGECSHLCAIPASRIFCLLNILMKFLLNDVKSN